MLGPHSSRRWYWEQILLARHLQLVAAVNIIPASSPYVPLTLFVLIQLSALLQHWSHPFGTPVRNFAELASLYLLLINSLSSIILRRLVLLKADSMKRRMHGRWCCSRESALHPGCSPVQLGVAANHTTIQAMAIRIMMICFSALRICRWVSDIKALLLLVAHGCIPLDCVCIRAHLQGAAIGSHPPDAMPAAVTIANPSRSTIPIAVRTALSTRIATAGQRTRSIIHRSSRSSRSSRLPHPRRPRQAQGQPSQPGSSERGLRRQQHAPQQELSWPDAGQLARVRKKASSAIDARGEAL